MIGSRMLDSGSKMLKEERQCRNAWSICQMVQLDALLDDMKTSLLKRICYECQADQIL